ncbi:preprotein translocase subunit SecG [Acanthopleuribacter pedis]|uniref:Protein-export membrane protein SecG n=1 Tax=Acanthopleuribacter pedis TaxID=442870 RepID=A0A8J7QNF0_9BACT|nr:preprotein translocase subunit SecG [Acanthopleuribacter pedis]MBO1321235.1 preprotein translocase subunit SecG [Acanthopleuribacter pedis]
MGFLFIFHIFICVTLILIILFQDGKTGGLVSVSDNTNSVFGAGGGDKVLTKLTSAIAVLFMVTSMVLAFQGGHSNQSIASDHQPTIPAAAGDQATAAPGAAGDVTVVDDQGNSTQVGIGDAVNPENMETVTFENLPPEIRKAEEERIKKEREARAAAAAAEKAGEDAQQKDN